MTEHVATHHINTKHPSGKPQSSEHRHDDRTRQKSSCQS